MDEVFGGYALIVTANTGHIIDGYNNMTTYSNCIHVSIFLPVVRIVFGWAFG
jgi:hypothetical protein